MADNASYVDFALVPGAPVAPLRAPHVELVCDLDAGIPLPSNTVDLILAMDVLEHLEDVVFAMNEMHRVLRPDGLAQIQVPGAGSYYHHTDPTHVRGFTTESFDFFDDATFFGSRNGKHYTPRRWRIAERGGDPSGNLAFVLQALKPGEQPQSCDLFEHRNIDR